MFQMSLAERTVRAEYKRARYRNDPAYRLAAINRARVAQGFEPYQCVTQIKRNGGQARTDG